MPTKKQKSKLNIETVSIKSIKPHPKNTRSHDEKNLAAIAKSIASFGQRTPVVIGKENFILKGCGTWSAMIRIGKQNIHVVRAEGLSDEQELAYSIADNKTTDMSDFENEKLTDVLKILDKSGYDLEETGFQEFEAKPFLTDAFDDHGKKKTEEVHDGSITIKFSSDQWNAINRAILSAKVAGLIKETARDSVAIMEICLDYPDFKRSEPKKKKPPRRKGV